MTENTIATKKSRSMFTNLKFLIGNAWKWDKSVFSYFGLYTIVTSVLPFIGIFAPKLIIDELTGPKRINNLMIILGILFLVSVSLNYLATYLSAAYFPKMIGIRFKFINMLEEKCMTMDFKHTEEPKTLNDIETAWRATSNNSDGIEGVFHRLFSLLGSFISLFGYVVIIAVLNPLVLLYLVLNVLVTYYLTVRVKKYEHSQKDKVAEVRRKGKYIYDTMYNFAYGKDIRIYNIKDWLEGKFKFYKEEEVSIFKKVKYKYVNVSLIDTLFLLLREGIVFAYLIYRVMYMGMSIGDFSMYFITISGFAAWMQKVMEDIAHIRLQNLYINDFRDFLEMDEKAKEKSNSEIPQSTPYEIEFKNVSFKYPNSERYIYKNLSLKIRAGERLAIVGINGAGKTTFVKLLTRLYEPTEGEILINGINIANLNKEEYYKLFSVVFQEIKMLAFSVAENVSFVPEDKIDRERVMECIEKAGMKEKINSLKKGIDTSLLKIIDLEGIELSGGENQKLALARALYKNGEIVILDEPTAALDPIAEFNIYKSFDELVGEKTAIYISHRLASTRFCDAIAFFEDGQIKEYGTHEELLEKKGRYAEIFDVQACYYREEAAAGKEMA